MSLAELLSVLVEAIFLLTQGHAWRIYVQMNRNYSVQVSYILLSTGLACPIWGIYNCYIILYTLAAYVHYILDRASTYPL